MVGLKKLMETSLDLSKFNNWTERASSVALILTIVTISKSSLIKASLLFSVFKLRKILTIHTRNGKIPWIYLRILELCLPRIFR